MNEDEGFPQRGGWGHEIGALSLAIPTIGSSIGPADRALVNEAVSRFARAIDERQYEVLAHCLDADFRFLGRGRTGVELVQLDGNEAFIQWLRPRVSRSPNVGRHIITNVVINSVSDGRVSVLAYVILTAATTEGTELLTTGFYRMALREDAGVWRVAELFLGIDDLAVAENFNRPQGID